MDNLIGLKKFFSHKIGINPESLSDDVWKRVVDERMKACYIEKITDYFKYLQSSNKEIQAFIEGIVVPETWFFRDRGCFDFMAYHVRKQQESGERPILYRVLSAPCSTGEEPYSVVMAFLYANIPVNSFEVHGFDISQIAIERAKKGIYKNNSFRGNYYYFQKKYFHKLNEEYEIHKEIRNKVVFSHANILNPSASHIIAPYDAILCRNLFIYLDTQSQIEVFKVLETLLKPSGILFVAPAEIELVRKFGYRPIKFPKAFAFVRGTEEFKDERQQGVKEKSKIPHQMPDAKLEADAIIEKATKFADEGKYDKAEQLCLNFIDDKGVNAKVYFILGQIYYAQGKEVEAEDFFLKAIYLLPKYYEALVYLSLICNKRNDSQQAELYKRRAEKAYDIKERN